MKNTLKKPPYYDFWILSDKEQDRFKNFHLPLFCCPSCWETRNGALINTIWSSCVACWYTESTAEFASSSLKQYQKKNFAFHLDISKKEHQEIIALFRDNVLWQCTQCESHNMNLPKGKDGEPDLKQDTQCEKCAHPFNINEDILPIWALKWFGFNDGDSSSNTYELKKLWEVQILWLQALAKARKIDASRWDGKLSEIQALQQWLEKIKRNTRAISGWKYKDGNRALQYIQSYLEWAGKAKIKRVTREVQEYVRAVSATNNPHRQTPYRAGAGKWEKFWYKLAHLDGDTIRILMYSGIGIVWIGLLASYLKQWEYHRIIGETSHNVELLREDKWTLPLSYTLSRKEPYYDEDDEEVRYRIVEDTSWEERYIHYLRDAELYRLRHLWAPTEKRNGSTTLDTGEDEWIDVECPTEEDDDTTIIFSWDDDSWWSISIPSWWGSLRYDDDDDDDGGLWFDGSGGMFHHPESRDFFPEWYDEITRWPSSFWQEILTTSSELAMALLWVSPAYAHGHKCGYNADITVSADRYITVQNYSVWDWKNQNWYSSPIISWVNYEETFRELEKQILTDNENQRIKDRRLNMLVEIVDEDGNTYSLPVRNEMLWKQLSQNMWEQCTIQKSLLMQWIRWITVDDIVNQCLK